MDWDRIDQIDEIIKLIEFEQRVHPKRDWVTAKEYDFWLKRGLKIYVLKKEEDEYIGIFQILDEEDEVFFHGFAVSPDYQGKGYGQVLMDHMVEEYGHKNITCKTRPDNHIMKSLLTKNGFANKLDEILDGGEYWTWWTKLSKEQNL